MILIDDQKYACLECIRGHRSSSCRHHRRPLLQVRTKGRPNITRNGHKNHRIAVFAEEIESEEDLKGTGGAKCSNKNEPVVILKASPKHIIDFTSGKILHTFDDKSSCNMPASAGPYISEDSFVNSTTCVSGGIVKSKKGCNCCPNLSRKVDKTKIVSSYLKRHHIQPSNFKFVDYSSEINRHYSGDDASKSSSEDVSTTSEASSESQNKLFDVLKVPSCTIPGSCSCRDDCTCAGCMVHGNMDAGTFKADIASINHEYANYINLLNVQDSNNLLFSSVMPSGFSNIGLSQDMISSGSHKVQDEDEPTLSLEQCVCETGACDCKNCETHGIIDGLHLDDLFASAINLVPEASSVKPEMRQCCSVPTE